MLLLAVPSFRFVNRGKSFTQREERFRERRRRELANYCCVNYSILQFTYRQESKGKPKKIKMSLRTYEEHIKIHLRVYKVYPTVLT